MSSLTQKKQDKEIKSTNPNLVFEKLKVNGYEEVYKITNEQENLLAIVAIHNTTLGVALGGTRIKHYSTFDEALEDVLRLSEGMTYKSAVAEVGLGGGKSVIILKKNQKKDKNLLLAFGEAIEALNGRYTCAEDMGCTTDDVMTIRQKTKYVVGLPHKNSSGDPGKFTAWGVYKGIHATLNYLYKTDSAKGKKIAIQGLGNVGLYLLENLFWEGADLIISDINENLANELALKYNAKAVKPEDIYKEKCDVFAPCAIGAILNDETIKQLDCKAVVGSANNQLLNHQHAYDLKDKNILYAPDFVVNAGGLLNVTAELHKDGYNPRSPRDKTDNIYNEILSIYKIADKNNVSTNEAAIQLAKHKLEYNIGKRKDKLYYHHSI